MKKGFLLFGVEKLLILSYDCLILARSENHDVLITASNGPKCLLLEGIGLVMNAHSKSKSAQYYENKYLCTYMQNTYVRTMMPYIIFWHTYQYCSSYCSNRYKILEEQLQNISFSFYRDIIFFRLSPFIN